MAERGPLADLRVLDATDATGRFATKLLAEAGASVVRVAPVDDPGPAMVDPAVAARGGLLDWWYEGGKRTVALDLDRDEDQQRYRTLAGRADLVVDTLAPGRLAAWGLDHASLAADHPRLVQVSLTPFGQDGPWAARPTTDLVAGALGGVLSLSGTPERANNPFGRQNLHFGSFVAALCGLAGVHRARVTGVGQHVDASVHEAVITSIENLWFQYWFPDLLPLPQIALRQGSLHWLGAYVVTQCRTGWCMITPTPSHVPLFEWMDAEGVEGAAEIATRPVEEVLMDVPGLMKKMAEFAHTKDAGELFEEAQRRHVAFGEVQGVAQVAANPQHAHRGFFVPVDWEGPKVTRPRLPIVFHGTPAPAPQAPAPEPVAVEDILAQWDERSEASSASAQAQAAEAPAAGADPAGKPLAGLRVLDFTWVLAGPFCCRLLGDLGADIIKAQTAERATLVNSPDFPYYYCWNRSKRSLTMHMKQPGALALARRVVEACDVIIENYSAGVLARWGLDYESVRQWNPGIVYVSMSGCGHDGPWSRMITYAPTIHALCGLTALSNPPGRGDVGPGFSLNDHAAGFTAAFAILAAIEARRRTGEGQHVDISQLEVGGYLTGAALMDYLTNGREALPTGNADPYASFLVNDVFTCAEGEVAVTVRHEADAAALRGVVGDADLAAWCAQRSATDAMEALAAVGVPAGRVQNAADITARDAQVAARNLLGTLPSEVFGARPFDRFPARWSASVLEPYQPSPAFLGEHNFEILTELAGLSDEEVATAMGDGLLA